MRRPLLDLLLCPRCQRGSLRPKTEENEIRFGPLQCPECGSSFPVTDGIADLHLPNAPIRRRREWMERSALAQWQERIRPLGLWMRRSDAPSQLALYRSFLGHPSAPILELRCGTASLARQLALTEPRWELIGMDDSMSMLEEALAQARESGAKLNFVRAQAPRLPFQAQSLGAVLHPKDLPRAGDSSTLMSEIARVLRPGGRCIAAALLSRPLRRTPTWDEPDLKQSLEAAGLVRFERVRFSRWLVFKVERSS